MRTLTAAQQTLLDGTAFQTWCQLWVTDGDGVQRDYLSQGGWNWIDSIVVDANIDQPVSQATITLRRDIMDGYGSTLSLSPLRSDSHLNRNAAGAFSPAIDAGRTIKILVATTTVGVAPVASDWQNIFEGVIDDWDIAKNPITITARDYGGALQDAFVNVATNYGSLTGTPVETVMQQVLDDWMGPGVVTLYCPVSPGYYIIPGGIPIQSVMDTMLYFAGLIGWDFRYKWDSGTLQWRPTLVSVPRTKTVPDRTITKSRYFDITQAKVSRVDVRNIIWAWYIDASTGVSTKAFSQDDASIARYGKHLMQVTLPEGSPITTLAAAMSYVGYLLSDLRDPLLDQIVDAPLDWSIELNDLIAYTANGVHYDSDQKLAVYSYKHTITLQQQRTQVEGKGAPCGRYLSWLDLASIPASDTIIPTLDDFRLTSDSTTDATYGWVEGAGTSEVWAGYQVFTAPVPDNPWDLVKASVAPIDVDTFTIPKPPAGSFTYAQIEPRGPSLTAGAIQRVVIAAGQPPINFGASPQGTGSVDNNGNVSFNGDLPQQGVSGKYLISTVGFPSDADVLAGGTIFNGRQFALTNVITLDFGDSAYMTVVPFDDTDATGTAGPSMRLRASYLSYNGTKTIYIPVSAFTPTNTSQTFDTLSANDLTAISPTNYPNHPLFGGPIDWAFFKAWPILPDGVEIEGISMDLYDTSTGENPLAGIFGGVSYSLYRTAGNTYLGGNGAANNMGWQTISTTYSEDTTGNSYYIWVIVSNNFTATTNFAFRGAFLTYTMPTPFQTV